jgi:Holliday junction resolvase RusA-like endonuclease
MARIKTLDDAITPEPNKRSSKLNVVYVIEGDPIPLARSRHVNYHVYDSQKKQKLISGLSLRDQHGERDLYEGPIHMDVTFFMRQAVKTPQSGLHFYKPDLSNLLKFVEDVCTKVIYYDDCLIASISAKKVYSTNPRTEFTIRELHGL